jgi:TPR repeat protein
LCHPHHAIASESKSNLRTAATALKSGEYEKAQRLFTDIAERERNPLALYTLGLMAENGWQAREPDALIACRWFEKAAFRGHDKSMVKLGQCLKNRTINTIDNSLINLATPPIPRDQLTTAAYWFRKAANTGHNEAFCHLGQLYKTAQGGVPQDSSKALQLCFHAARNGSAWAQRQVGQYFATKSLSDFAQAAYWYQQAAVNGDAPAAYALAELYFHNPLVMAERFSLENRDHRQLARDWYEVAAGLGLKAAYTKTALLYYQALNEALGKFNPSVRNQSLTKKGGKKSSDALLAKAYLWLRASHIAYSPNLPTASLTQADAKTRMNAKISQSILEKLRKIMPLLPRTWIPDLEAKIQAHFQKYPTQWPVDASPDLNAERLAQAEN